MWIAKPLKALSQDEAFFYQKIVAFHSAPLSQSLLWGNAILSTGTEVYVAFDTEKKIGGMAFFYQDSMECINGPMLNWGKDDINEELATFVYALTQANKQTKKVILKPRFEKPEETLKTNYLKFPIHSYEETATKILKLNPKEDLDLFLGPKIRSELQRTHKHLDEILLEEASLDDFYQRLSEQYRKKKEFLPEKSWFEKLLPASKIFSAQFEDIIHSQVFMTLHHKTVYYLFANEVREEGAPNISLNLLLQRQAIEWAIQNKAEFYDLSGYKRGIDKTDSYWGVKVFKDKFPGEIVDFVSPVFIFE